ncbi:MAG: hypothetical protein F6K56_03155 [Moorea sp. SIO3G5]|nr:hypothetical protein [Moorena sp. SIO3G5]
MEPPQEARERLSEVLLSTLLGTRTYRRTFSRIPTIETSRFAQISTIDAHRIQASRKLTHFPDSPTPLDAIA